MYYVTIFECMKGFVGALYKDWGDIMHMQRTSILALTLKDDL